MVVLHTIRLLKSDIVKVLIQRELKKYGCDIKSIEQPFYSIHKKANREIGRLFYNLALQQVLAAKGNNKEPCFHLPTKA